jgi:outer membrane lipoprotein-sorting protein
MLALALTVVIASEAHAAEDWVSQMVQAWSDVQSYRAEVRVQERVDGTLRDEVTYTTVYRKPAEFQVAWLGKLEGQRVYLRPDLFGGNARMLRAGPAGRAAGILTLAPDDATLRQALQAPLDRLGMRWMVEDVQARFARSYADLGTPSPDIVGTETVWRVDLPASPEHGYGKAELAWGQHSKLPASFTIWDAGGQLRSRVVWARVQVNGPIVEQVDFDLAYTAK